MSCINCDFYIKCDYTNVMSAQKSKSHYKHINEGDSNIKSHIKVVFQKGIAKMNRYKKRTKLNGQYGVRMKPDNQHKTLYGTEITI